ncbi:MAG: hypothetical protein JWR37_405 [Mycobacterium sp.]|jgi:hypothetical protein|nr:hypothetical protein [Mycobacterium sp.]
MSTVLNNLDVHAYAPGRNITGEAFAPVVAKTFLGIAGDRTMAGSISVATATAGGRVFGVAAFDAAAGQLVGVARNGVVRVICGAAALAAGVDVQSDAAGKAVAVSSGKPAGYTIAAAAVGAEALVALF